MSHSNECKGIIKWRQLERKIVLYFKCVARGPKNNDTQHRRVQPGGGYGGGAA